MAIEAISSILQSASIGMQSSTSIALAITNALVKNANGSSSDTDSASSSSSSLTIADAVGLQLGTLNPFDPYNPSNTTADEFINPFQYLQQDADAKEVAAAILSPDNLTLNQEQAISSSRLLNLASYILPAYSALEISKSYSLETSIKPFDYPPETFSVSYGSLPERSAFTTFGEKVSGGVLSADSSINVFTSVSADEVIS